MLAPQVDLQCSCDELLRTHFCSTALDGPAEGVVISSYEEMVRQYVVSF